jgi:hypothetical protein
MINFYKREPVLFNVGVAIIIMLVNHFALDFSAEVSAIIDVAVAGLAAGVSRQIVTSPKTLAEKYVPVEATRSAQPSERYPAIPQEHSSQPERR